MTRAFLASSVLLLTLSACSKGAVSGSVTDGLSGQPVSELRILARSEATDLTCQAFETTTDASGAYSFDALCAGNTYTLSSGDEDRFFTGTTEVSGDAQLPDNALQSWIGPDGSGVYILDAEGKMTPMRTHSDVQKASIFETETMVRYPDSTPGTWPRIVPGTYLMLVGQSTIENQKLHPMETSPEVKFNPDRDGITHFSLGQPWLYIGAKMDEEGGYTQLTAQLDEAKLIEASAGERAVRYIPADALPAGKYALLPDKAKRTYMMEFGAAPAGEEPASE